MPSTPLHTLDEARAARDGVVILEGDHGGIIYAVAPAARVTCSADVLQRLLWDVDALVWANPRGARVSFEHMKAGTNVLGGTGGGRVVDGVWVHALLTPGGHAARVEAVLTGKEPNAGAVLDALQPWDAVQLDGFQLCRVREVTHEGQTMGNACLVAPDGARAALRWATWFDRAGGYPSTSHRWGIFYIPVEGPLVDADDATVAAALNAALQPRTAELRAAWEAWRSQRP